MLSSCVATSMPARFVEVVAPIAEVASYAGGIRSAFVEKAVAVVEAIETRASSVLLDFNASIPSVYGFIPSAVLDGVRSKLGFLPACSERTLALAALAVGVFVARLVIVYIVALFLRARMKSKIA